MSRAKRISILKDMLMRSPVSTQEALVTGLEAAGISVTQATVSRDLSAIGAVRGPEGYRLKEQLTRTSPTVVDAPGHEAHLNRTIRSHVIGAAPAGSLVVVRTAPGHADFVATELDASPPEGVVGSIAGDDTIFLATASNQTAKKLANDLNARIEGTS